MVGIHCRQLKIKVYGKKREITPNVQNQLTDGAEKIINNI